MSAFPASMFDTLARWRRSRRIFVSYRRADTQDMATLLYERLASQFGAANVFMDRADIEHGQRWREEVTRQIAASDMFLVLIGPSWLQMLRARSAEDDVLRTELTSALEQKKQIIPILVGETIMPSAEELPAEMRGLTEFQALPVSAERLEYAMLSLLGRLKPGWRLAVSWGVGQLFGWLFGILILIAALAAFGWMEGDREAELVRSYPFLAAALAGALAGACVAAPQWLLLRPWFRRASYLLVVYVVLSALATGYAGSVRTDSDANSMVLGFMVILLPIAFAASLWWVVSEKLVHAGWWSAANLMAPLFGLVTAIALHSKEEGASAQGAGVSNSLGVLADFLVPMVVLSLGVGWLLVWLMRRSEIRRR